MRILVVSEGKHELGDSQQEGALVVLVRRAMNQPAELATERISDPKVRVHWRRGEGQGFVRRVLAWLRFAERQGFAAMVLVIDRDGHSQREKELASVQSDSRVLLPRALGVAIETFDAWMLADERALGNALGQVIQRQREPERMRDPKSVCRQLLKDCGEPISQAKLYTAIARVADLDLISDRCAQGFAPLLARLRAL
jgi:hypothetical protein